ncbi:unnamed protein product [Jaminaea pallidilutea]
MTRSAAGPAVLSTSTRPPGAVSRAQQPAPRGAMQSGAAAGRRDDGDDDEGEDGFSNLSGGLDSPNDSSRGRAVAPRRQWRSTANSDDDADGVGPLPSGKNDREGSGSRDRRSRSRDSSGGSIAKRLGAGLSGVLRGRSASRERESRSLSRQNTDASTILEHERGRDQAAHPTGRGGAGNMFRSPSRGRPPIDQGELAAQQAYAEKQTVVASGRGGAGNVRSPSRDPLDRQRAQEMNKQERELQAAALRNDEHSARATGRGGAGNLKRDSSADRRGRDGDVRGIRSSSRSRSREPRSASSNRAPTSAPTGAAGPPSSATAAPSGDQPLSSVDESASMTGSESTAATNGNGHKHHNGVFGKLASHIPGHGHHH